MERVTKTSTCDGDVQQVPHDIKRNTGDPICSSNDYRRGDSTEDDARSTDATGQGDGQGQGQCQNEPIAPFQRLPQEIRDMIYAHIQEQYDMTSVLHTCRQLRAELLDRLPGGESFWNICMSDDGEAIRNGRRKHLMIWYLDIMASAEYSYGNALTISVSWRAKNASEAMGRSWTKTRWAVSNLGSPLARFAYHCWPDREQVRVTFWPTRRGPSDQTLLILRAKLIEVCAVLRKLAQLHGRGRKTLVLAVGFACDDTQEDGRRELKNAPPRRGRISFWEKRPHSRMHPDCPVTQRAEDLFRSSIWRRTKRQWNPFPYNYESLLLPLFRCAPWKPYLIGFEVEPRRKATSFFYIKDPRVRQNLIDAVDVHKHNSTHHFQGWRKTARMASKMCSSNPRTMLSTPPPLLVRPDMQQDIIPWHRLMRRLDLLEDSTYHLLGDNGSMLGGLLAHLLRMRLADPQWEPFARAAQFNEAAQHRTRLERGSLVVSDLLDRDNLVATQYMAWAYDRLLSCIPQGLLRPLNTLNASNCYTIVDPYADAMQRIGIVRPSRQWYHFALREYLEGQLGTKTLRRIVKVTFPGQEELVGGVVSRPTMRSVTRAEALGKDLGECEAERIGLAATSSERYLDSEPWAREANPATSDFGTAWSVSSPPR